MTILKLGAAGPQVSALQERLQQRGFGPGEINGQFCAATQAAVEAFQRSVGLQSDGVAGPNTVAALQMPAVRSIEVRRSAGKPAEPIAWWRQIGP